MSSILLQTTITDVDDDWNVGRFSLLADELRRAGHQVTARNRDVDGRDDPVLSALDCSEFDQLWLMAVDTGLGLSENDAAAILRFRAGGGECSPLAIITTWGRVCSRWVPSVG